MVAGFQSSFGIWKVGKEYPIREHDLELRQDAPSGRGILQFILKSDHSFGQAP